MALSGTSTDYGQNQPETQSWVIILFFYSLFLLNRYVQNQETHVLFIF